MADIILENINKSFEEKQVLTNVNAVIKENKITCLMGSSGIGKTTLLNILMGIIKADSGNIKNMPQKKSAVFQENRLCEGFSVMANIKAANSLVNEEVIKEHLNFLKLENTQKTKVSTLSGGMKRRVALIRAVLAQKDILFLDEPFKGLDDDTRKLAADYLLKYAKNTTVLMVTHQKEDAENLGAEILYLENGTI